VEAVLRTSVRRRLMSDVPLGTMCSGGVDSSVLTAFAADEQPGIHAFNVSVQDQPEADESVWASRVAERLGVELHTVSMTAASWRRSLVDVVRHVEYPLTHESSVPMAQLAALARQAGVKVLLSGEGADELFGGYPWRHSADYTDFRARGRHWESAARALYRGLQRRGLARRPADFERGPLEAINAEERSIVKNAEQAYGRHKGPRRRLEAGLLADLELYLPHLLVRQDKATMKESIETREPFLDPDVVSLAVNLPLESRVEPRRKELLRGLADRHVLPGVGDRSKIGFGFDVARYIESVARPEFLLAGHLREVLGVTVFFDSGPVRSGVAHCLGGRPPSAWRPSCGRTPIGLPSRHSRTRTSWRR
jgi:asparagine synthase (glutamine-hydrolysing)